MLSIDIRQSVIAFLSRSEDFEPLFDLIRRIAEHYDNSTQFIIGQSEGGDKLGQAASALQSRFTSMYTITQTIVPRRVYKSLEVFRDAVEGSFDVDLREDILLKGLLNGVEAFVTHYDTFLMEQNPSNAAKLMLEASILNRQLSSVLGAFRFFNTAVGGQQLASGEEEALSLVLYEADSFCGFVDKLAALNDLYSELCMLVQVSESSHPLRIGKIESGSLWVKVFGDTKVTQLIAALIESTVGYLHRRFTTEGKIGAVPKKLETLDAAIQISAKLNSIGVDTSEMNEHLRKSGVTISKSLATLLEDQPRITLNDRLYSVGARIEPFFLTQRATLQLPDGTELNDSPLADEH